MGKKTRKVGPLPYFQRNGYVSPWGWGSEGMYWVRHKERKLWAQYLKNQTWKREYGDDSLEN